MSQNRNTPESQEIPQYRRAPDLRWTYGWCCESGAPSVDIKTKSWCRVFAFGLHRSNNPNFLIIIITF